MADDEGARRIDRLAQRAKELDDMIAKAAKMQKRIVEEIRRIGVRDRVRKARMSAAMKSQRRKKKKSGELTISRTSRSESNILSSLLCAFRP